MQYSPASGIAFYHIHKTGGTSVKVFLSTVLRDLHAVDYWPHHALAVYLDILARRGVDPARLRLLATVRDPLEHVVSIYPFWRTKGRANGRAHVQAARDLSFREFVRFYVACRDADCRVYDQLLLLGGAPPPSLRILRLEHLVADMERVLNDEWGLDVPVSFPRANANAHDPAPAHYDADTARLVRDRYAWVYRQGLYPWP
jgi:hypothetical protein